MNLGTFSLSLPVRDLAMSEAFYKALGFVEKGGNRDQGWLVLRNGCTVIGLFQGMFDRPMLTFNPGWDENARPVDPFDDVRALQSALSDLGLDTGAPIESTEGPAHFMLTDPDGNPVLIDQHR